MSSNNLFEPLTETSSSISEESENNCIEVIIPIDINKLSLLSNISFQEGINHKNAEAKENKEVKIIDKDIDKDIIIIESENKLNIKKDNSKNEINKKEYNLLNKKRRDTNDTKEEGKKEDHKNNSKNKVNKKKDDKEYILEENDENEDIEETLCDKESHNNEKTNHFRRRHDRFEGYNIKRKIISHYFKFLSGLINIINRFFFKKEKNSKIVKFAIIRYNFKELGLEKKQFKSLKEITIEDLLLNYQNDRSKNKNKKVYNIVVKKDIINKILKEKCFDYGFVYKYYNNIKEFNLLKYNYNVNIHLDSKIKSFEDLLKSNLSNNEDENEKYKKEMEKCIQKFFFDKYFKV